MPTPPRLPKLPSLSSALCLQDSGWLDVGAGHRIAWSRHGTPDGMPAVVLHGGPGSGSSTRHLEFFDLARWQVVLFDQRGCGRSTPLGGIAHNTTTDVVGDIEALRQHLGIARWLVVGGSWGATLALTYALRHGQHCLGLLLRGTFLGQQADIDWFVDGARAVRPAAYAAFAEGQAPHALIERYAEAFRSGDAAKAHRALVRWLRWEAALEAPIEPPPDGPDVPAPGTPEADRLLARGRIQTHYLRQRCFLKDSELIEGARGLGHLPGVLLHGTHDLVCRPANAEAVHAAWPGSVLHWVPGVGHAPFEPAMQSAMRQQLAHFLAHGRFAEQEATP